MTFALLLSAVVIVLDQVTKYMVAGNMLLYEDIPVISGFFHITYVQNTGMAWSMLSGQQILLSLAAAVAIGVMLWVLITRKPGILVRISLGLMIGGAAGNLIDRLLLNHVRDFLNFYIFGYDFPVFNIADVALCIGVAFLILDSFLEERKEKKQV